MTNPGFKTRKSPRVRARIDRATGMNKTETAWAEQLEIRKLAGELVAWKFEPVKLRLANKTFYTPDFMVIRSDGTLEFQDVKGRDGSGPGGWEDDAKVKIKVAAKQFPEFHFVGVAKLPRGAGWKATEF